jgi:PAS domain S-box-containing protein
MSGSRQRRSHVSPKPANDLPPKLPAADAAITILDSVADGVFTVDLNWKITFFNRAAEKITGIPRQMAIGRTCCEIFRANVCEAACVLRKTIATKKHLVNRSISIVNNHGIRVPISISTAILRDSRGRIIGGVETFRDLSLVEELKKDIHGRNQIEDIITVSPRMLPVLNLIPPAAESDSSVLIMGESGVGKELVARALHSLSPRRHKPLITVNCGAIPETLLESELFGYMAGAFTDAKKDKPGRFALAEGGTLFLDEIGDLPSSVQVKLLRVLQEHVYEPLGATKTARTDARIITATNRDLPKLVRDGIFRQDLFFRINVIKFQIPPLRERKEDIPMLVEHFIQRFNRLRGLSVAGISPEALDLLTAHEYFGNVRELENLIEYAFVLCRKGLIKPEHLSLEVREGGVRAGRSYEAPATLRVLEADFLREVLRRHGFDRTEAARELKIHPVTLWRKMRKLGLIGAG